MQIVRSLCGTLLGVFGLVCLRVFWKHLAHPEGSDLVTKMVIDIILAAVCMFSAYALLTWEKWHPSAKQ
jgi:hypothetical protein